MRLEDHFDLHSTDDICFRGTRIGIEMVLHPYLHQGLTAEQIQAQWPALTLEQINAALLAYQREPERLGAYVEEWLRSCREAEQEAEANPSPAAQRVAALQAEISSYPPEEREAARRRILERERSRRERERTAGKPLQS